MDRAGLQAFVNAAPNFPPTVKAAARLAVQLMPEKEVERVAGLIERAKPFIEAEDWRGMTAMLEGEDLPPQIMATAKAMLNAASNANRKV